MSGPDPESLRRIYEQLPDFVGHMEKKRALRGGRPASQRFPTKVCAVCGKPCFYSDIAQPEGKLPELSLCERCQGLLSEGWTAFVAIDKFAFGKSKSWPDIAGKIAPIKPEEMEALQTQFLIEWQTKEPPSKLPEDDASRPPSDN